MGSSLETESTWAVARGWEEGEEWGVAVQWGQDFLEGR